MLIRVQVFDDDCRMRKETCFDNAVDLIAWICRCFQATRRAHGLRHALTGFLDLDAEPGQQDQ